MFSPLTKEGTSEATCLRASDSREQAHLSTRLTQELASPLPG